MRSPTVSVLPKDYFTLSRIINLFHPTLVLTFLPTELTLGLSKSLLGNNSYLRWPIEGFPDLCSSWESLMLWPLKPAFSVPLCGFSQTGLCDMLPLSNERAPFLFYNFFLPFAVSISDKHFLLKCKEIEKYWPNDPSLASWRQCRVDPIGLRNIQLASQHLLSLSFGWPEINQSRTSKTEDLQQTAVLILRECLSVQTVAASKKTRVRTSSPQYKFNQGNLSLLIT